MAAKLDLAVITGPSQGLGLGVTKALLAAGYEVIGISRSNPADSSLAIPSDRERYRHLTFDLSETDAITKILDLTFNSIRPDELRSFCLINNAAVVEPLSTLAAAEIPEIERAIAVNLLAPLLFSAQFIRRTQSWVCDRRIVHISSGLAVRAMTGSGVYCISKAALESLNRQIAEEQKLNPHPIYSVAFRPGVIDTQMQEKLRNTPRSVLPEVDYFRSAHDKGQLRSADQIADILMREVIQGSIRNGACYTLSRNGCEEVQP